MPIEPSGTFLATAMVLCLSMSRTVVRQMQSDVIAFAPSAHAAVQGLAHLVDKREPGPHVIPYSGLGTFDVTPLIDQMLTLISRVAFAYPIGAPQGCEVRGEPVIETATPTGERIAAELVSSRRRAFVGRGGGARRLGRPASTPSSCASFIHDGGGAAERTPRAPRRPCANPFLCRRQPACPAPVRKPGPVHRRVVHSAVVDAGRPARSGGS
jgi:hypothetical protein